MRLVGLYRSRCVNAVSIHAPREGCDGTPLRRSARGRSFNSRTPGGVRHHQSGHLYHPQKFQFTHPGRGATSFFGRSPHPSKSFNSRTPGGVRRVLSSEVSQADKVSIHAPREGCDSQIRNRAYPASGFQFTHPGRGATGEVVIIIAESDVSI